MECNAFAEKICARYEPPLNQFACAAAQLIRHFIDRPAGHGFVDLGVGCGFEPERAKAFSAGAGCLGVYVVVVLVYTVGQSLDSRSA